MAYNTSYDVEKNQGYNVQATSDHDNSYSGSEKKRTASLVGEDGAVPGEAFEIGTGLRAKLMRFARRYGVEARGIERVPEDERTDCGFKALLNVATMVSPRSGLLLGREMMC